MTRGSSLSEMTNASTCPAEIARMTSSLSLNCAGVSAVPSRLRGLFMCSLLSRRRLRSKLQSNQRALRVGQVADDLADRVRQPSHECRDGDDLIFLGESRIQD